MEIYYQKSDDELCKRQIHTLDELSDFITKHYRNSYYLYSNSITYQLIKRSKIEQQEYPRISMNIQGRMLPQELTITVLDDFYYFLFQYPSQQYLLEINCFVFKMQRLEHLNRNI